MITMGGTIKMTITAEAYQPVAVETTFLIEKDENMSDEQVEELNEKIEGTLKKQLQSKLKIALKEFANTRNNINKIMNS